MERRHRQGQLWHDNFEQALLDVVYAVGGPKEVASRLWPEKTLEAGARYLNQCLDPERHEKLEPGQIVLLMKWGYETECHTHMAYLADAIGYEEPQPKNPDTERDRLQREFIHAQEQMSALVRKMERFGS